MARKRRRPRKETQSASTAPFGLGARVRVAAALRDADLPLSLQGWSGTVIDIDAAPGTVPQLLVEWDDETRQLIDRELRERCRQLDIDPLHLWLNEDDLETAPPALLPVETRPEQADFQASFPWPSAFRGGFAGPGQIQFSAASILRGVLRVGIYGGFCGALLGGMLRSVETASTGVAVAATIFGVLGWLIGARFGWFIASVNRVPLAALVGGLCGLTLGGLLGALAGAAASSIVAAYTGALAGMVVGVVVASLSGGPGRGCLRPLAGGFLGTLLGSCVETIYRNPDESMVGAAYGSAVGAAAAVLLSLLVVAMIAWRRPRD
jgi:hypothetical protein